MNASCSDCGAVGSFDGPPFSSSLLRYPYPSHSSSTPPTPFPTRLPTSQLCVSSPDTVFQSCRFNARVRQLYIQQAFRTRMQVRITSHDELLVRTPT
eukprot:scaffold15963_cov85-Skeletonema_marinoi.AAC.1